MILAGLCQIESPKGEQVLNCTVPASGGKQRVGPAARSHARHSRRGGLVQASPRRSRTRQCKFDRRRQSRRCHHLDQNFFSVRRSAGHATARRSTACTWSVPRPGRGPGPIPVQASCRPRPSPLVDAPLCLPRTRSRLVNHRRTLGRNENSDGHVCNTFGVSTT